MPNGEYEAPHTEAHEQHGGVDACASTKDCCNALTSSEVRKDGEDVAQDHRHGSHQTEVYLPPCGYGSKAREQHGDISLENITAGELALTVSTGDIAVTNAAVTQDIEINVSTGEAKLQNTTCKSFSSDGSTGDITLENLVASEKLEIERSTGNIILKSSDAAEVDIETDTGDVRGSFKTDKIIFAKTNTGRVDVPKSTSGGRCEIETDPCDIKITVE